MNVRNMTNAVLKQKAERFSTTLYHCAKANPEKMRPLGIPTIEDRVVQQAVKFVLEPIFETTFKDSSYGFRPKRSAHQAMKAIWKASQKSYWVVDVDIKGYFDNINHRKLMLLVEQKISDKRILALIRKWLKAGVMEDGSLTLPETGSPQGGVISPLLDNIYLNVLDHLWEKRFQHLGTLVRYADDQVEAGRHGNPEHSQWDIP